MRAPATLEIHGPLTPTNESLKTFLMMLNKMWMRLTQVINGHIAFGNTNGIVDWVPLPCDNFDGVFVRTDNLVAAGVDVTLEHDLNRLPTGYFIVDQTPTVPNTPGVVYIGSVARTLTQITVRFSAAGQYLVIIF